MRMQRSVFFWVLILAVPFAFLSASCEVLAGQVEVDSTPSPNLPINPDLLTKTWTAQWITCPDSPERDAFVFHFRKVVDLPQAPQHFIVQVSADNQFLLHVNQKRVGTGPARGDLAHWRFETYDLAPFLHAGRNVLSATVWGFGTRSAYAQISDRAGFLLQGDGAAEHVADTNESWEVEQEKGLLAPDAPPDADDYYAAEPGERIDGRIFDWSWDADPASDPPSHATARWKKSATIDFGGPREAQMQSTNWQLVPDLLPAMEMNLVPPGKVVRASGVAAMDSFPDKAFVVTAHTNASILIDATHLTTGYPELTVSGGQGASVHLTYAEALVNAKGEKGNRNEIEGKHIKGLVDEFVPSGSPQVFMPVAWRAWRYLQLDIVAGDQPLQVDRLRTWFTAFPFKERAYFHSDDPSLASVWEIGWRTARLDAHDTYMDTPYWERLQYVGDTRIQALISYTVAGDDRLARQAIRAYDDSRIPDGITQSRYPSSSTQYIPTFSLLWIGMLHDFWLYRGDADFVRAQLPGTRPVLDWFMKHQRSDGLLEKLPWWDFVDWADDFDAGVPPQDVNGGSAPITLQFVEALQYAAEMETTYGDKQRAEMYRDAAAHVSQAIRSLCWNQKFGLIADTPAQTHFSQHANILGVWLDVIPPDQQKNVLMKVLSASETGIKVDQPLPAMSKATYYFRFYLARAVLHAGMGDKYLELLPLWRNMAALGMTTWAETPEPTRSDSHAWSAHPNFDLLTIVAGIRPMTPGFKTVTIEPHLGALNHLASAMPCPQGEIQVEYTREQDGIKAQINLPAGTSGDLIWKAKTYGLHEGSQEITLPAI
jgi:alpha-L-rhamnosidase